MGYQEIRDFFFEADQKIYADALQLCEDIVARLSQARHRMN